MIRWKHLGTVLTLATVLSAQALTEDPVMKARAERAQAGDGDLPPVPRAILEPPPLPPPETHVKDTKGWRAARRTARSRRKVTPKGKVRPPVVSKVKRLPKKKS